MDGNGRWANRRGLPRNEGHRKGVDNVEKIVEKSGELGIRYLTLYAFSAENWKRPKPEVSALMSLLESFLKQQRKQLLKNKIRLHTIGRVEELPPSVLSHHVADGGVFVQLLHEPLARILVVQSLFRW